MRLKVLLTGKDKYQHMSEAEMLKERGFLVYRCEEAVLDAMIDEVKPDVVIINPIMDEKAGTTLYQRLLKNIKYKALPLIYTLSEDDVYIVNRARTRLKGVRNFIVDNIVDGIKTALTANTRRNPRLRLGF